jgi:hypothetical protein
MRVNEWFEMHSLKPPLFDPGNYSDMKIGYSMPLRVSLVQI